MVADASGRSAVLEWVNETDAEDNDGSLRKLNVIYNDDDKNHCTVHSVVYNLTQKTGLWVSNEHYGEEAYTFELSVNRKAKPRQSENQRMYRRMRDCAGNEWQPDPA